MCQKGSAVERRQSKRNQIEVDIEIAHPGSQRCFGCAKNISRTGVSVHLWKGALPEGQRSVILNFKVWTGNETLYRKIYARVVRTGEQVIALEFAEHDFVAEAIIQDLMFYQKRERRERAREPGDRIESGRQVVIAAEQTV
jgi:c-di-GMP-binding flagellar brake protein YcgR